MARLLARTVARLLAVEIVTIHTNPKRQRGNDLATSLTLRVSVILNREQYSRQGRRGFGGVALCHNPAGRDGVRSRHCGIGLWRLSSWLNPWKRACANGNFGYRD